MNIDSITVILKPLMAVHPTATHDASVLQNVTAVNLSSAVGGAKSVESTWRRRAWRRFSSVAEKKRRRTSHLSRSPQPLRGRRLLEASNGGIFMRCNVEGWERCGASERSKVCCWDGGSEREISLQEKSKQQIKGAALKKQKTVARQHLQTLFRDTITRGGKKRIPGRGRERTKTVEAALMCLFWTGPSHPRVSRLAVCLAGNTRALLTDTHISNPAEPSRAEPRPRRIAFQKRRSCTRVCRVCVSHRRPREKLHGVRFHFPHALIF